MSRAYVSSGFGRNSRPRIGLVLPMKEAGIARAVVAVIFLPITALAIAVIGILNVIHWLAARGESLSLPATGSTSEREYREVASLPRQPPDRPTWPRRLDKVSRRSLAD
jgi:hypothetical protein